MSDPITFLVDIRDHWIMEEFWLGPRYLGERLYNSQWYPSSTAFVCETCGVVWGAIKLQDKAAFWHKSFIPCPDCKNTEGRHFYPGSFCQYPSDFTEDLPFGVIVHEIDMALAHPISPWEEVTPEHCPSAAGKVSADSLLNDLETLR